ncbi:MAG TPA: hypothetical protein VIM55_02670 [Mucilaginibacter sp.]
MNKTEPGVNQRRGFLRQFLTGAAALSAGIFAKPVSALAAAGFSGGDASDADEWFKKIKGKHRMMFDVTEPHGIFPFAWPRIFLMTNGKTGTPAEECSVVVVLRHSAAAYAMGNQLWEKYKFGEFFKIDDMATNARAVHNPFWQPKPGTYKGPGIGEIHIGIDELQASGVMFCVCDVALTALSATIAGQTNQDAATVKKEWIDGLLPGVQVVPSGIWAVGRAQEHGCAYCFAS